MQLKSGSDLLFKIHNYQLLLKPNEIGRVTQLLMCNIEIHNLISIYLHDGNTDFWVVQTT